MSKTNIIKNNLVQFYIHSLLVGIFYLVLMSLFRVLFFFHFKGNLDTATYLPNTLQSFLLGFRLDLTVVGYIYALAFILSSLFYLFKSSNFTFFKYYYALFLSIILLVTGSDFGFYSYFKEHINILFFGLFDDDTSALMVTFWDNYNVLTILAVFIFIIFLGYFILSHIFSKTYVVKEAYKNKIPLLLSILPLLIFLMIRGTFEMYPLGKMLPNLSTNNFINQTSQNSVRSFIRAYQTRQEFKNNNYDLIAQTGFSNHIEEAFKLHNQKRPLILKIF